MEMVMFASDEEATTMVTEEAIASEVTAQCWLDVVAIGRRLSVLASAGMRLAGNTMIWTRSLAFIAAATS